MFPRPSLPHPSALLAVLLVIALALTSCSDTDEESTGGALDELGQGATSSERIETALAAGEIDEPTSRLYRLWAQFGDRRLPEQFRGAPETHDLAGINDLADDLDALPADIREQVAPFFERPSNPASAFSQGGQGADGDSTGDTAGDATGDDSQAMVVRPAAIAAPENTRCSQDWVTAEVPDQPFRVWACPDGDPGAAQAALDKVSEAVADRVGPMLADAPNGMGQPMPDDPNADANQPTDDKIDIYVLPSGWLAPYRDLNERRMDEMAAAITMPAAPRDANSSSAYMLLASYLLDHPEALEGVLVHELFHVLQYAHFGGLDTSTAWAFEASALWAQTQFGPDLLDTAYSHHLASMQEAGLSLLDPEMGHRYSAFLWFLFLEQEGGPEAVYGMWHALDAAAPGASSEAVVAAIADQVDLEAAYPEFAMRLLNADLAGDPITPRLHAVAPRMPDGRTPDVPEQSFDQDTLGLDQAGIPGLGYRYTHVSVPSGAVPIRMTSTVATPSGTVAIEAVAQGPDGNHTRIAIDPAGTDLCLAGDLWLMVTNTATEIGEATTGGVELTRGEGECGPNPPTESPIPTEPTTPTTSPEPSTPTEPSTPPETLAAPTGDFCSDMLRFQKAIDALADGSGLPVSVAQVSAIFALAEPHRPNLPDGGSDQVRILREYADRAADQSASAAASVLAAEEFVRNARAVSFLVQHCAV